MTEEEQQAYLEEQWRGKNGSGFYQQHYQFYYYRETYPFMRQKTYLQHEPILIEVKSLELLWL